MRIEGMRPVKVIAHRGASDDVPEHTLAAYRKAIQDGADALECDVRLTRDGHLVCVHDRRVDRTSDGRGVVSTLELADLAELDFSAWRRRQRRPPSWLHEPELLGDREEPDWDVSSVLTLDRLLQLVVDSPRRVELAIETKHPTRYSGAVERALCDLLEKYGLTEPVGGAPLIRVMSFASSGLRRVQAAAPRVPTVLLLRWLPLRYREGELPARIAAVGPAVPLLRRYPWYVQRVQDSGREVYAWTADDPVDIDYVLGLGVDAVISNRPRLVRARLAARANAC